MKICKHCSREYEDDMKFCPECGARLEEKEEDLFGDLDLDSFLLDGKKEKKAPKKKEEPEEDFLSALVSGKKSGGGDKLAEKAAKNKEMQKKLAQGRSLCIQGKFAEAKKFYEDLINEDPGEVGGFIGLVRVESKDFTVYESQQINEYIRQTVRIARTEDFSKIDDEYSAFLAEKNERARKEKERAKAAAKRAAELKKAQEEKKRKEEEERLAKAKEAARIAKEKKEKEEAEKRAYDASLLKARTYCIQRKFSEAKEIYDGLIEKNPSDVKAFIGLARVATEDYSLYEGKAVESALKQVSKIAKVNDYASIDKDYAEYLKKREKHFADLEAQRKKEEALRKAEQARLKAEALDKERKAKEEADRRAREEAARKAKEAAEKAKAAAAKKAEEAKRKAEELKRQQAELERVKQAAFDKKLEEARRGYADAQYYVAQQYYEGNIVSQDYSTAVYWLEKAVKQKHAKAAELLGDCYLYGNGVSPSAKNAKKYYHLAEKYEK